MIDPECVLFQSLLNAMQELSAWIQGKVKLFVNKCNIEFLTIIMKIIKNVNRFTIVQTEFEVVLKDGQSSFGYFSANEPFLMHSYYFV